MKKRIGSLLLILALCFTLLPTAALAEDDAWNGSTAAAFAGGTGTAEDPYQIANGAELAYLASSVNSGETYEDKYFVLTANINLNGLPWTPIANSFSDALFGGTDYRIFAGNFDGDIPSLTFPLGLKPPRLNRMYLGCLVQRGGKSAT